MQLRHGTVQPGEGTGTCQLAYPILVGDTLHGVVAIDMTYLARDHLDIVMRLAQWGAVWFSRLLQSAPAAATDDAGDLAVLIDLFAQGLAPGSAAAAAEAMATNLAERLGLEKLSLGLRRGQAVSIFAVSHGGFTPVINDYLAALRAALAETADDGGPVAFPAADGAMASPHAAHARLCRIHGSDWVRSVPVMLNGADGDHDLLIMVAEGSGAVVPGIEDRLAALGTRIAPLVAMRLRAEEPLVRRGERILRDGWARLIVPRTRNIAIGAAIAALLILFVIPFPYHIQAEATLEPGVKRALVAPFDGYMAEATARPGDRIAAGQPLGRLDDRDLRHQKRELGERQAETNREITEAMGHYDNAKVGVLTAHRAQIEADIALVDESLSRTVLTAPYDAFVVSGDKTQSGGAPVHRGDTLYEISPLTGFRLELDVPQGDFADVAVGQAGRVLLSSVAGESFPFHIVRITPIATIHDGKTVLRVEADLDGADPVLRPGMSGVGEIHAGHAHLLWLLTHHVVDWLRLKLWAWLP